MQDDAALKIQRQFRRFRHQQVFRKRSFGKFGTEAVELIRRWVNALSVLNARQFELFTLPLQGRGTQCMDSRMSRGFMHGVRSMDDAADCKPVLRIEH